MADNVNKDEIKGRAKEATGVVTGDEDLEREGKVDQAVSNIKEKVDHVADKVKGAFDSDK